MDFQIITRKIIPWFLSSGIKVALIMATAFIVNRFFRAFVAKTIHRIVKNKVDGKDRKKRVETLSSIFSSTLKFIVLVLAFLMILPEFGINIAPILAGVGLFGLAVGMAAKDVISDFIAGLFILLEGQYSIGNKIKIAGVEGIVKEFTLRRTILQDGKGNIHSVPNSQIKTVTNRTE